VLELLTVLPEEAGAAAAADRQGPGVAGCRPEPRGCRRGATRHARPAPAAARQQHREHAILLLRDLAGVCSLLRASRGPEPSCSGVDAQGGAATVARPGNGSGNGNLTGFFFPHKVGCSDQCGPTKLGLAGRYTGCTAGDEADLRFPL